MARESRESTELNAHKVHAKLLAGFAGPMPEGAVLFENLGKKQCKWPVSDAPLSFCGCGVEDGQVYCTKHSQRAHYRKKTRKQKTVDAEIANRMHNV